MLFPNWCIFPLDQQKEISQDKKVKKLAFPCVKGTWSWGLVLEPQTGPWIVIFERLRTSFGGFKEDQIYEFRDNDSWGYRDGDGNFEPKGEIGLLYSLFFTLKLYTKF